MELIKLYTAILQAAGCIVDEKGFVSLNKKPITGEENEPLIIDGKRVVLPLPEQLQNLHTGERIVFHPLYENAMHGESVVIAKLRSLFSNKLSYTLASIMNGLLTIASSVKEHHKLNPDQSEFLTLVKDADSTTMVNFSKYIVGVAKSGNVNHMVNIYLKRGGLYKKTKHNRVGVATFAAYKDFKDNTDTKNSIGGVKMRIKDKESIINLFEYILPGIDVEENYNFGSNSDVAPFMHALMKTYGGIAAKLNDVLALFNKHISNHEAMVIDSTWVEAFDNLGSWLSAIRSVPMQNGNEGSVRNSAAPINPQVTSPTTMVAAPVAIPTPVVVQPPPAVLPSPSHLPPTQFVPQVQVYQQPNVVAEEPVVTESGVNFRAALNKSRNGGFIPQQYPQQGMYPQPYQQPGMYPQQPMQPMYQQPFQQPQYPMGMQQMPGYPMNNNMQMRQQVYQHPWNGNNGGMQNGNSMSNPTVW